MKNTIFPICFLLFLNNLIAQNFIQFIKDHALEVNNISHLDSNLYEVIRPYDVILMGEMHGTKEPSLFITGLANLIVQQEGEVSVGLEIPAESMELFRQDPNDSTLLNSAFFQAENLFGRNGKACYEMIKSLYRTPKVNLFFFDHPLSPNRDSSMYMEVLKQKKEHPHVKIITLSGNIHNRLKAYNGNNTLGSYLTNDSAFFSPDKIMSINHLYHEGSMMNNSGKGLEKKIIIGIQNNIYNSSVVFENYLCPNFLEFQNQYSHFLFTRIVTHSEKLEKE